MQDFESLTIPELEKLARDAMAAADKKRITHKKDVRKKCVDLIRSEGLTVADVFPESAGGGAGRQPSYPIANPNNPSETWAGKGRRPSWLTQALVDAASD